MPEDTAEEWRQVPGYENLYDVSNRGRVRSWKRWPRPSAAVPRQLTLSLNSEGYARVALLDPNGVATRFKVHVLVLMAFVGPRPKGLLIRHLDGNPANNVLENIVYGTLSENAHDTYRHGRGRWSGHRKSS